jgi:hypothetical protein
LKSDDSAYHVRVLRGSLGPNPNAALDLARRINFSVTQADSVILLPSGFPITKDQKFRNQQVIVAVYVPVGKKILLENSVNRYHWFTLNVNRQHIRWDDDGRHDDNYDTEGFTMDNNFYWNSGVQYIMTTEGLQRVNALGKYEDKPEQPEKKQQPEKRERPEKKEKTERPVNKTRADTPAPKATTMLTVSAPSTFMLWSGFL